MFRGHLQDTAVVIAAVLDFGAQRVVALHSRHERHQLLHRHGDSGWDSIALAGSFVWFR